jgi:hypothetical protein
MTGLRDERVLSEIIFRSFPRKRESRWDGKELGPRLRGDVRIMTLTRLDRNML